MGWFDRQPTGKRLSEARTISPPPAVAPTHGRGSAGVTCWPDRPSTIRKKCRDLTDAPFALPGHLRGAGGLRGAFALLQSLVTPVLPTIQQDLHTDQTTVTWVLTAYLLSASIFTPIIGRIGDKVGKERMFVVALGALAIGSLIAALAASIGPMIVARVIQGIGGGVLPISLRHHPRRVPGAEGPGRRRHRSRRWPPSGRASASCSPARSSNLLNYHWLFWIPMIITALAAVAAHFFVPESPVRTPGQDQRAARRPALRLAGRAAARAQPGSAPGAGPSGRVARPARRGGRALRRLGRRRGALGVPADRHEDDAPAGRVDDQPRRAALRLRDVRLVRLPAPVHARRRRPPATASAPASPSPA